MDDSRIIACIAIIALMILQVSTTAHDSEGSDEISETINVTVSLSELLGLLQGRDGKDGRDGRDGIQGPKGDRGDVGPQGLTGPAGPVGPPGSPSSGKESSSGGAVYVRWGRTTCPTGRELVYSGQGGKAYHHQTGGGINYQCLPDDPEYGDYQAGTSTLRAYIYGVEYQNPISSPSELDHHNVPCAVCRVPTRATSLMIPAKLTCPTGWTEEYDGYLMAERYSHTSSSTFECVDHSDIETIPNSSADLPDGILSHVEAQCGGLACPPYDTEKEVTCVVCTI